MTSMISLNIQFVLCAFIILSFMPYGLTIKCFTCRSMDDPKCADPFDNSTVAITDCDRDKGFPHLPEIPSMCRKIRQKVNGDWRYIRDCATLGDVGTHQGDGRFCLTQTGPDNVYTEYCTCYRKDGCNSSSMFKPVPLLFVAIFAGYKVLL